MTTICERNRKAFIYSDVETYRRTLSYYQKAIDLDPSFANAHAGIARVAVDVWRNDYNFLWSAAVARKIAYDAAGQALKLDPNNARAHTVLALLQLVDGRETEARDSANRAVAAQPNDAEALSATWPSSWRRPAAMRRRSTEMEKALAARSFAAAELSVACRHRFLHGARQRAGGSPDGEPRATLCPRPSPHVNILLPPMWISGDRTLASQETAKLLELFPDTNLTYYGYLYDYWREDDLRHHLNGLRAAGMPEWPFGFEANPADQIGEAELSAMVNDKTWTGKHKNGTEFIQYFDTAGNTAYRSANTNITGLIEVRGNRLCETIWRLFPGSDGMRVCLPQHSAGAARREICSCHAAALMYFSLPLGRSALSVGGGLLPIRLQLLRNERVLHIGPMLARIGELGRVLFKPIRGSRIIAYVQFAFDDPPGFWVDIGRDRPERNAVCAIAAILRGIFCRFCDEEVSIFCAGKLPCRAKPAV